MKLLYSCAIAFSMYSRLPVPQVEWKQEHMEYVMCFFPLVGLAEGAVMGLWLWLALRVLSLSPLLAALWGTALPLLLTGGIHMDGFMDCMDAVHSYGDREKKLAIMKDPHLGAFAVIALAVYLLLYVGSLYEYGRTLQGWQAERGLWPWLLPMLLMTAERALSGLSVVLLPRAKRDGLAAAFAEAAKIKRCRAALLCWLAGLLLLWLAGCAGRGWPAACAGVLVLAVLAGCFFLYRRAALREFGGVSGDLAGAFLQGAELAGLTAAMVYLRLAVNLM